MTIKNQRKNACPPSTIRLKLKEIQPYDEETEMFVMQAMCAPDPSSGAYIKTLPAPCRKGKQDDGARADTESRCGTVIPMFHHGYRIFPDDVFTEKDCPGLVKSSYAIMLKPWPL